MADTKQKFRPLLFTRYPEPEMVRRAQLYRSEMSKRRSVREFSDEPVPRTVIEDCILTAGSAPSGANRQPWHFSVVHSPEVKRQIRLGAEEEERAFYDHRAPDDWLEALAPLGTDAEKPFLEQAPALIVIFAEKYGVDAEGNKQKNYYVPESVGIATGMLISALHHAGLATLTHTPSPMKFLNQILDRPEREKPTMILVVGYPEPGSEVPDIQRKTLFEISSFKN
ncbi:MAG: nitroreductase family protein [Pseudomonadota bacterium]